MNVLILGGNGFLGRHMTEAAREAGQKVRMFDLAPGIDYDEAERKDILDLEPADLDGVDMVYHLAGRLGTAETFGSERRAVETNVLGTLCVLEAARISGTAVTYVTLGNTWLNPYTITKNAAADFCRMYLEYYELPVTVVVTYNIYGPYQKWAPIKKIVPTFLTTLLNENRVEINGDGEQVVDLVYAADFARELLALDSTGTHHIGSGRAVTVNRVAEMCATALGMDDFEMVHLPPRRGEPVGSVSLSPHSFVHIAETPYEQGLKVTADWYRSAIARARASPKG